jgi:formylglycine-generating enzyme required for sulfatase activity
MKRRFFCLLATSLLAFVFGCSADGSAVESDVVGPDNSGNHSGKSSGREDVVSSSSGAEADSTQDSTVKLSDYLKMVDVPAMTLSKGSAKYRISAFSIGETEVTQGLYREVMGEIEEWLGENHPVFNVSWYDAALFCNALSKKAGLDTAYVYESVNDGGELINLSINYATTTVRLPTEMEWEIATRAGTSTTYYWDTDVASKYAYYAQDKGPVAVAGFTPNALGLYDMAGNVAEWVNDWYGAYPTVSQDNYTGPAEGTYKGIRGGGWSDKAPALASAERDKKDPKYHSQTIGFRIVYSKGF